MSDIDTKNAVWEKGETIMGYDPKKFRKDQCGAWIAYDDYGNRGSLYGWEIDHITSLYHGGSNFLSNLRPLQWENNASKGAERLVCKVASHGNINIRNM